VSFVDDLAAELDTTPRPMPDIITFQMDGVLNGYKGQVVTVPRHGLWKVENIEWLKTPKIRFVAGKKKRHARVVIRKVDNLELMDGALSSQDDS